jgi:hypothetical protein
LFAGCAVAVIGAAKRTRPKATARATRSITRLEANRRGSGPLIIERGA